MQQKMRMRMTTHMSVKCRSVFNLSEKTSTDHVAKWITYTNYRVISIRVVKCQVPKTWNPGFASSLINGLKASMLILTQMLLKIHFLTDSDSGLNENPFSGTRLVTSISHCFDLSCCGCHLLIWWEIFI